ncbi:MAG TPA: queuosine precursor transporter [Gammaproteobacteria bacterium]|nr:queuosine precursor transporter [Gammaproteobacteria bacterium]
MIQDEEILKTQATPSAMRASIVVVGIIFAAFLILSNLTAFKLVSVGSLAFPAGLIFFPLTYIFDDILTEVYGFKVSRRVIWSALCANVIVIMGTFLTVYLPPAPFWHEQSSYATVYQAVPRVFLASIVAYLAGEFTNSIVLAKLKVRMAGRHFWMRAIASTGIGVGIDTVLFTHIAFGATIPYVEIWRIIITMYLVKVGYEICAVPLTYKVANYLKRKDDIDYFDYKTKFNPFSIAID